MTTGEYNFCFRLSPFDCTASKEEPELGLEHIVLQQGCVSETKVGCMVEQEFLAGGTGTRLPGEHRYMQS